MKNGDISNGVPLRVLVHIDVVTTRKPEELRFFWVFRKTIEHVLFDRLALSAMWRFSVRQEVLLDLIDFENDQGALEERLARLDMQQSHPFRNCVSYEGPKELSESLPYRQDVVGVIDLPERGLYYGSRWIDLSMV